MSSTDKELMLEINANLDTLNTSAVSMYDIIADARDELRQFNKSYLLTRVFHLLASFLLISTIILSFKAIIDTLTRQ